jgi:hypothetical protein
VADKQLQIKITANDGASAVFRSLGASAKQAANDITGGAKQSVAALKSLGDESGKTEKQIEASKRASTEFAVAGAALGASVGLFSRSIVENNQNLNTLQRTYGDATGTMKAFADQVQATTSFSSESAVQAENIFGTLVRNYGLSVDQVQQLVKVSTDLATTSGFGLTDVAERLQSAIRGEGEAAEALGLTMNQQSIDRNNLTLTMSNQEAAQFRLNALMQQTSFAEGAAGEKAASTAGQIAQLNNKFQDMARGALEATGPLPQVVSGLTNIGAESGLAITGLISLAKGFKDAASAAGDIKTAIQASQGLSAAIGTAGVVGAIGLAAVAAVMISDRMGSYAQSADHANQSSATLADTIARLSSTMTNTALSLDLTSMEQDLDIVQTQVERIRTLRDQMQSESQSQQGMTSQADIAASNQRIAAYQAEYNALVAVYGDNPESAIGQAQAAMDALTKITSNSGAGAEAAMQDAARLHDEFTSGAITFAEYSSQLVGISESLSSYQSEALSSSSANQSLATSYGDVTSAIAGMISAGAPKAASDAALAIRDLSVSVLDSITYFADLGDKMWSLSGGAKQAADVTKEVTNILTNGTEGQIHALGDLERAHASGQISANAFAAGLAVLNGMVEKSSADAALNAAQNAQLGTSFDAVELGARKAAAGVSELSETANRAATEIHHLAFESDGLGETGSRAANEIHHIALETDGLGETANRAADEIHHLFGVMDEGSSKDNLREVLDAQAKAAADYAAKLAESQKLMGATSTDAGQFQFDTGTTTQSIDVAVNLQVTKSSLDAVMGVIKTAQGLSSQLGETKSFADELIGDPGTWAQMDQLLQDGRISWRQWQAAQEAQVSITRDVANAQQDLLAVQVNLAPTLAEAVNEQANYINSLQDMTATQQMAALGWMDNAEAAKAMSLAQLVAASTTDTMQASTQEMITAAAAADPVLKAMLEDMGLISAEDGTVNFDTNAETIQESVDHLTTAILGLTDVIINVPFVTTDTNAPDTQIGVDNLHGAIDGIPDSHGTNIYATDNASGVIGGVSQELDNINGKTASTYLNNYVTTFTTAVYSVSPGGSGLPAGTPIGGYTGLTVSGFAGGGTISGIPTYITGGTHAIVGERGPELVWLPNGSQVTNTEGSKAEIMRMRKGGGGAGTINIYGPMTLNPASSDAYEALQQEMRGGARR